jgi:hypothetical protein
MLIAVVVGTVVIVGVVFIEAVVLEPRVIVVAPGGIAVSEAPD